MNRRRNGSCTIVSCEWKNSSARCCGFMGSPPTTTGVSNTSGSIRPAVAHRAWSQRAERLYRRTARRQIAGARMFLKKFVFVNWGNVPNCEFDIGPVSLFSGANGSGKTTAADAIQTVMTAAHENLFHYNPGQDESTQRGRGGKRVRTLASYVLGCDDGSYARTEATDGYIAAIFHPTRQETAEVFTAVVGMRAWLDRS